MQEMLKTYSQKGDCKSYATGSDSFPVADSNVISIKVTVNGTEGTFLVDTGASYVALNPEFANRAGIYGSGVRRMMTANGEIDAKPATGSIRVGKLHADDVPIVVLEKSMGKTDGLLGRSFLSRFEMTVSKNRLTLKTK
jgi:aspartyl protease family protein